MRIAPFGVALLLALPAAASADPGDRDTTFGKGGTVRLPKATTPLGPVLTSEGRIVVASPRERRLFGYTGAGRVDRSFGRGGVAPFPPQAREIVQVLGHRDGIVLAGGEHGTYRLTRLHRDGGLDRGFGPDGDGSVTVRGEWHSTQHVTATPAGELYVAFYSGVRPQPSRIARHRPDGALDPAFGDGGLARVPAEVPPGDQASAPIVNAVYPTQHGVLIAVGIFGDRGGALTRLTASGVPDPAFGAATVPGDVPAIGSGPDGAVGWIEQRTLAAGIVRADGSIVAAPARRRGPGTFYGVTRSIDGVAMAPTGHLVYGRRRGPIRASTGRGVQLERLTGRLTPDLAFSREGRGVLTREQSGLNGLVADRRGRLLALLQRSESSGDREDLFRPPSNVASLVRLEGGVQLVRVRSARRVRGGVRVRVACLRAARAMCEGSVRAGRAQNQTFRLAPGRERVVRLRLFRRPRGPLTAVARVTDGTGQVSTSRRAVKP